MIFRHALLAAAITGLATTAYAQTTPTTPDAAPARPAASDSMKSSTPAPVAADAGKLIGRSVSNPQNEKIGKIESVYVTSDGKVDSVLVSVGGFLGIGDREVKLGWNDLQVMDNGEKVVVNMTKDELKAMAPYEYKDNSLRGKVFGDRGVWTADRHASADTSSTARPPVATTTPATTPAPAAPAGTAMESTGDFNAHGDISANAVIGAKIRNTNKDTVGSVQDLYVDGSGNIQTVVVSVGGFLGVGSKDVAVKWSDLKQSRDGKSLVLTTDLSKDALQAMADYKDERRQPAAKDQAAAPPAKAPVR